MEDGGLCVGLVEDGLRPREGPVDFMVPMEDGVGSWDGFEDLDDAWRTWGGLVDLLVPVKTGRRPWGNCEDLLCPADIGLSRMKGFVAFVIAMEDGVEKWEGFGDSLSAEDGLKLLDFLFPVEDF